MEDRRHTWLTDLLENLAWPSDSRHHQDEFKVYRRVAITIRALVNGGHAVIVGRGGAFLTAYQPGGIHIRLVAPLAHRVAHTAERDGLSQKQAAGKVAETERNREAFYRRHWPGRPVGPEAFTITFNSAQLTAEEMVDCVLPLIHSRDHRQAHRRPELTINNGALQDIPRTAQGGAVQ